MVDIGLFEWIFRINNKQLISDWIEANDIAYDNHLKEAAIQTVMGKITNTATMVEFETSDESLSYLLNVKPNRNQNAMEFKRNIIEKLILEGECLVINEKKMLYIADSFSVDDKELAHKKYENITIGNMVWKKTYFSNEVFHFKYRNQNLELFLRAINESYGKLFSRVLGIQMRERQLRLYMKYPSLMDEKNEAKLKVFTRELQSRLEDESVVVIPRQDNYEIEEKSQSYVGRPIREVQDVEYMYIHAVANMLQVSPLLFTGELADVSQHTQNFINHCIKPLMNIIVTEINAKYFEREELKKKDAKLKLNTVPAIYTSEMDMAADVEKMIGSGVWTIDDVRDLQSKDRLETKITTQRYLTKNIAPLNDDGSIKEE